MTITVKNSTGATQTISTIDDLLTVVSTAAGQASILAKLSSDPATQTTLAAILAKLTADPATQTTLTAILNKIIASPATSAKQDSLAALVGEVQVTPTTYTLLARLKDISTNLTTLLGAGIGVVKYTVAVTPGTPFTLCRALNVGLPGMATLTYENTTTGAVYLTQGWNPIACTNVSASGLDAALISACY